MCHAWTSWSKQQLCPLVKVESGPAANPIFWLKEDALSGQLCQYDYQPYLPWELSTLCNAHEPDGHRAAEYQSIKSIPVQEKCHERSQLAGCMSSAEQIPRDHAKMAGGKIFLALPSTNVSSS